MIKSFAIKIRTFKNVTQTFIDSTMITFPKLVELDLLKYQNINEASLARLINGCIKSLKVFKVSYACNGLGMQSIISLAKCRGLTTLQIGEYEELYSKITVEKLNMVKKLLAHKSFSLQYLTLYQSDQAVIDILTTKSE